MVGYCFSPCDNYDTFKCAISQHYDFERAGHSHKLGMSECIEWDENKKFSRFEEKTNKSNPVLPPYSSNSGFRVNDGVSKK